MLSKKARTKCSVDAKIFLLLNWFARNGKLHICMNKMGNLVSKTANWGLFPLIHFTEVQTCQLKENCSYLSQKRFKEAYRDIQNTARKKIEIHGKEEKTMSETKEEPGMLFIRIHPGMDQVSGRGMVAGVRQWIQSQIPVLQFSCCISCVTWASYLSSLPQCLHELSGAIHTHTSRTAVESRWWDACKVLSTRPSSCRL